MTSIADIFTPAFDLLLIKRDPPSRVVGVGLGGGNIIAPETTRETGRCHTGVVIKAGPQAHEVYEPGTRVVFAPFSATVLAQLGGSGGEDIVLLPPAEVICLISDQADPEEQLAESWAEHAEAPPGCLLVERAEKPVVRGRIVIPDGTNAATRSAEAEVVSAAQDVSYFRKGDTVLLGGGVGRSVGFGLREEKRYYRATPRQVLGLLEEPLPQVVTPEESPLRHAADIMEPVEPVLDEGDPRAPR